VSNIRKIQNFALGNKEFAGDDKQSWGVNFKQGATSTRLFYGSPDALGDIKTYAEEVIGKNIKVDSIKAGETEISDLYIFYTPPEPTITIIDSDLNTYDSVVVTYMNSEGDWKHLEINSYGLVGASDIFPGFESGEITGGEPEPEPEILDFCTENGEQDCIAKNFFYAATLQNSIIVSEGVKTQPIPNGYYDGTSRTITFSDADLKPEYIREGVNILGVDGTMAVISVKVSSGGNSLVNTGDLTKQAVCTCDTTKTLIACGLGVSNSTQIDYARYLAWNNLAPKIGGACETSSSLASKACVAVCAELN